MEDVGLKVASDATRKNEEVNILENVLISLDEDVDGFMPNANKKAKVFIFSSARDVQTENHSDVDVMLGTQKGGKRNKYDRN